MRAVWKRELQGYFYTPIGYVFIGVFLAVASALFSLGILKQRSGDLPAFIGQMSYIWMLLSPVLTMRLLAEEKQKQTDQLLLTSPASLPAIVLGKYLAAITVLLLTAALTGCYAAVVGIYGQVFPAELVVNYLGFILQGCAFVALDLFLSGCAANPVTAAVLAFGANFLLWILDLAENAIPMEWLASALRFISLYRRNEPFLMGQLSLAGVLYDLSFIAAFLALAIWRLDRRRNGSGRMGRGSALLLALVLCALAAGSIGADRLEQRLGRVDYSFNSIATRSEETNQILQQLDKDVHIWALFRKGQEDALLLELLSRYAAATPRVTWEQADPALNPALLARFSTDSQSPNADSLIVWCEETGRFRVLGPEDYISLTMDQETGTYSYAGYTYEQSITGAISFVTRDRIPRAVILQGHGELDGERTAAFVSLLEGSQYEVAWADLAESSYTPDPDDLLIFFSPLRDLTEAESEKLSAFAAQGGSFLFTCDYSDPIDRMPRYAALLRSYGFAPLDGIVTADRSEEDTYYNGSRITLIPTLVATDLTVDLLASGADQLLMPGVRAFAEPEDTDRNLTVLTVLRSGDKSYLKALSGASSVTLEKTEDDASGPFALALEARRTTAAGYISRAFIIGSSATLTEEQIYAMTDSRQLTLRVMSFLLDLDTVPLNIPARDALRPALGPASTKLGSVVVSALPLAVLLVALLILLPRRNR